MVITGAQGKLMWGYHEAATIHPWSITKTEAGERALTGHVESSDTYRVSQQPLVFVAANGWRWPVVALQMTGASLVAVLGPKEKSTHVEIHQTSRGAPAY